MKTDKFKPIKPTATIEIDDPVLLEKLSPLFDDLKTVNDADGNGELGMIIGQLWKSGPYSMRVAFKVFTPEVTKKIALATAGMGDENVKSE